MKTEQILKKYSLFRRNMGIPIDRRVFYTFWEQDMLRGMDSDDISIEDIKNSCLTEKVQKGRDSVKYLLVFNWVEFIAISGSVASGFAKDDDDIDIFIVVRNDRAWIYRAIILFRNIFHNKVRIGDGKKGVKDKLCINFISEERGLSLNPDIFNLNEIISLIPLYKKEYLGVLFNQNEWLFDKYLVSRKVLKENMQISSKKEGNRRNFLLSIFNLMCLSLQILYMLITRHDPDIGRIRENYQKGRIEFFPKDFKMKKINSLEGR